MDTDGDGAALTVWPTSGGMVSILVEPATAAIPVEFEPDEAGEVAGGPCVGAERAPAEGRRGDWGEGGSLHGGCR